MYASITNIMVHVKKTSGSLFTSTRLHWFPHELVERVLQILSMLILNDQIMHDHTSGHDVPWDRFITKPSRPSHNRKLGLRNPKNSPYFLVAACALWK